MKITRSFQTTVSESVAIQRAAAFLVRAGYRQHSSSQTRLRFRRGSLLGTLTSFDPTRWSCEVSVSADAQPSSCSVEVMADIATDPSEKRFAAELISSEFNRLEAAVANTEVSAFDLSGLKRKIASHVYRVVGLFASLIGPAVLAVLAYALAIDKTSTTGAWAIALATFLVAMAICLLLWQRLTRRREI